MFPKKNRIKTAEINKLLSQKKFVSNELFILKTSENTEKITRFGVIVSKKVSKSAVKRHLIKRRIFNLIKDFSNKNKEEFCFLNKDFLIILRPQIKNWSFTELKKYLIEIILKNKFLFLKDL